MTQHEVRGYLGLVVMWSRPVYLVLMACSPSRVVHFLCVLGAAVEMWWYGTVIQVIATALTTKYRIQFEHGTVGETCLPSGKEALLDKFRVHESALDPNAICVLERYARERRAEEETKERSEEKVRPRLTLLVFLFQLSALYLGSGVCLISARTGFDDGL